MKTIIFGAMLLAAAWSIFWKIGYLGLSDLSDTSRQSFIMLSNIKDILVIILYIAWRVTPESKR